MNPKKSSRATLNLQLWELGFTDRFTDPVQELGTKQETGLSGLSG